MPVTTKYVDGGLGYLVVGERFVKGSEVVEISLQPEEPFRKIKYWLYDFSETSEVEASSNDMRKIAEQDLIMAKINTKVVGAVVAPHDIVFGFARMWEVFATDTGWIKRVFRTRSETEAWIQDELKMVLTFK